MQTHPVEKRNSQNGDFLFYSAIYSDFLPQRADSPSPKSAYAFAAFQTAKILKISY
jgi:hypothetical protein